MNNIDYKFWSIFYMKWVVYIISFSFVIGFSISIFITFLIFIFTENSNNQALLTILLFNLNMWILLGFSLSFILSFKKMFHIEIMGQRFSLSKNCYIQNNKIEDVKVEDIRGIWRVWLLKTVFYTLVFNLIFRIIKEFFQIELSIFDFYTLIISIFIIGGINIIYIFAFHKDIALCKS